MGIENPRLADVSVPSLLMAGGIRSKEGTFVLDMSRRFWPGEAVEALQRLYPLADRAVEDAARGAEGMALSLATSVAAIERSLRTLIGRLILHPDRYYKAAGVTLDLEMGVTPGERWRKWQQAGDHSPFANIPTSLREAFEAKERSALYQALSNITLLLFYDRRQPPETARENLGKIRADLHRCYDWLVDNETGSARNHLAREWRQAWETEDRYADREGWLPESDIALARAIVYTVLELYGETQEYDRPKRYERENEKAAELVRRAAELLGTEDDGAKMDLIVSCTETRPVRRREASQ